MGIFAYNDRLDIYQYSEWDSRELELTVRYKFNTAKNRYKGNGAGDREGGSTQKRVCRPL